MGITPRRIPLLCRPPVDFQAPATEQLDHSASRTMNIDDHHTPNYAGVFFTSPSVLQVFLIFPLALSTNSPIHS